MEVQYRFVEIQKTDVQNPIIALVGRGGEVRRGGEDAEMLATQGAEIGEVAGADDFLTGVGWRCFGSGEVAFFEEDD